MLRVSIAMIVIATTLADDPMPCTGWHTFLENGHCYRKFCDLRSWTSAKVVCEQQGGYLATPRSSSENTFIAALSANSGKEHWYSYLGWTWFGVYRDNVKPGTPWKLIDGTIAKYNNFNYGEPNNGYGDERCVNFKTNGYNINDHWNDYLCEKPAFYVCERNTCHDVPP
ncbi:lectin C-type domain protein [Ancylostoma ceylanicum]|nr:lectin C-type domain protein [Ancylostoma ceylanicum]